jgi:hypothetical protein
MTPASRLVAYDLSEWSGYLLPTLLPSCARLTAEASDSWETVRDRLPPDVGTFVFHIDLTDSSRCPAGRAELVRFLRGRGARILNGGVTDISKRHLQAVCAAHGLPVTRASPSGPADEPLIVKTNRNYGGKPEAELDAALRAAYAVDAREVVHAKDHGYRVLPRAEVEPSVWADEGLIVERFVANPEDLFYRVYFIGRHVAISEGREHGPVKTIGRAERRRLLLFRADESESYAAPAHLRRLVEVTVRFIRAASMDFGCLDVVRDAGGEFYVIDMNATPHWGAEKETRILDFLRSGCDEL